MLSPNTPQTPSQGSLPGAARPGSFDPALSDNAPGGGSPTAGGPMDKMGATSPAKVNSPSGIAASIDSAVGEVAGGGVAPLAGVDFAALSTAQLAEQAMDGARDLGRAAGGVSNAAGVTRGQARIAGVREQLAADGASDAELAEFDRAVADVANLSALQANGDSGANAGGLLASRRALEGASLSAFQSTDQARATRLPGPDTPEATPAAPIAPVSGADTSVVATGAQSADATPSRLETALNVALEQSFAGDVLPFKGDLVDFGRLVRSDDGDLSTLLTGELFSVASQGAQEIGSYAGVEGRETDLSFGQSAVSAVRDELVLDGASPEVLGEYENAIRDITTAYVLGRDFDPVTREPNPKYDPQDIDRGRDRLMQVINSQRGLRLERLEPLPVLNPTLETQLEAAIEGAVNNPGTTPFTEGNPLLGANGSLADAILSLTMKLAEGVRDGDSAVIAREQNNYGAIKSAVTYRGGMPAEIEKIDAAFVNLAKSMLRSLENGESIPLRTADARSQFSSAIFSALVPERPDGVGLTGAVRFQDSRQFDGSNGEAPVSIIILEQGGVRSSITHAAAVENVVEKQLQDAGQGYSLTNLNTGGNLSDALSRIAAEAPDYANMSFGERFSPDFFNDSLKTLKAAGSELVKDVDLSIPITVDNIADYADLIREIALNIDDMQGIEDRFEVNGWERIGDAVRGYESIAAAGTHVFASVQNEANDFVPIMFASDAGASGSITIVGAVGEQNVLETDTFWLPGEPLPTNELVVNGVTRGEESTYYRGELVDVFAADTAPARINDETRGASFATPEMLVQAVLGRFDPKTEQRIPAAQTG